MKSKICWCNGTILKKDLTRFMPLMLLAGLLLWAMGAVLQVMYEEAGPELMITLPEPALIAMFVVMLLGLFSAICLFTYLTKKKECDAIHALPIRRETLFFTKLLAALIQFGLPMAVFYAFLPGERGWFFQMGISLCVWLFYFGLATLAMMLAGRRLAGYILFTLICDLGSILYSVLESLYLPLLPGVYLDTEMTKLSPTYYLMNLIYGKEDLSSRLLPMVIFALLGIVFLALSLVVYSRRKLERAGDFLAVKWLEPVLAWMLGIYGALFVIGIFGIMDGSLWIALPIGLAIGYFGARMFFARSIRVFSKENLLGWAALVAFMAVTIYVTSLDPLGIVERVPETEQIESITLYDNQYATYNEVALIYAGDGYTATDPAEIDQLRAMHKKLLLTNDQTADGVQQYHNRFYLVYDLKNGGQMIRTYYILGGEELKQAKYFLSQPENLVGTANLEELLQSIEELRANGVNGGTIHTHRAFLEIFLEECEEGWMYTPDPNGQSSWDLSIYTRDMGYRFVDIPLTAQKTIAWLEDYFGKG